MAKTTTKKPATGKAVAQQRKTEIAAAPNDDVLALMEQDAGKGTSTDISDNVVPLVYILQSLSPQTLKKKEEYIDGAEAGMIWFRGTKDLVSGEEGVLVQPVLFSKVWLEWMPNRGGFVARHDKRPADAVQKEDPQNPKRKFWERPGGNIVVETREHVVLIHGVYDQPAPFVISMSGSNHTASRNWMTSMNRKQTKNGGRAPSFAFLYRLTTTFRTNDQGDWYAWDVNDETTKDGTPRMVDAASYMLARQLHDSFASGALRADNPDDDLSEEEISSEI